MVRKALESIKYVGGSTLTSKAIDLAIAEMKKGRRPDAKAAIVLMNDGMVGLAITSHDWSIV